MRRMLWFTIGYITLDFLCVKLLWNSDYTFLMWELVIAFAFFMLLSRKWRNLAIIGWMLLGCLACTVRIERYQSQYLEPLFQYDGQTLPMTVTALEYSEPSRYSDVVTAETHLDGDVYRILVYLDDAVPDLHPGDQVEGLLRLRITAPGGLKESSFYQGNKTFLIGSMKEFSQLDTESEEDIRWLPVKVNAKIQEILDLVFPEDASAFAKALFLGDKDFLDYETDTALKISGIAHLAAVSGLHIGFLYGLILAIFGRKRFLTPVVTILVLTFFAAIVGFTPSVCRACLMTAILAMEWMLDRQYDGPTALAVACFVMIWANPFAVMSVGLQLSAASVIGIFLFQQKIQSAVSNKLSKLPLMKRLQKLSNLASISVSMSVSAMVTTMPLCAYYFKSISLISILTNLLTIWIVSAVFAGILMTCVAGFVCLPLAKLMGIVLSIPIRYITGTAALLAKFPLAAVYTGSVWIRIWLCAAYGLGIYCFLFHRRKRKCFAIGMASLAAAIMLSWGLPRLDSARITAIYVGEGQCLLLQSKGESMLVDCGGNYDQSAADYACEELLSQGIFRLDAIVITHYDRDHIGGLPYLLTRISADTIYCPDVNDHDFLSRIADEEMLAVSDTMKVPLGEGTVTLFQPGNMKTENENSMCILFESEKCDILITGDRGTSGEKRLLKEENLPDVDILVAGHHGSKNSTSDALLQSVQPEIVLISCGKNNSYGHPAQELLERLEEYNCTVYRTDLQGNILIRR